ncbi:dihydrofolate reductase [Azomonas agilis]|nr:dihydrofolate reductase [Azomonas agilis]
MSSASCPQTTPISLAMIVAVAKNGVIGQDNRLPWHLPQDLQYFKARTLGKPIIMGRKTWESLKRPLPGRLNLVVSRQPQWQAEGAEVFPDLSAALERGQIWAQQQQVSEVMVIGGSEVFAQALPWIQRLYLTRVNLNPEGDAHFPDWQSPAWHQIASEAHPAQAEAPAYTFEVWERQA